jgi:sulfur-oxidizing protein SoxY
MQIALRRSAFSIFALAVLLTAPLGARAEDDPWPEIRSAVFEARDIVENDGIVMLYAPDTAEDAALLPLSIRFPASVGNDVKSLTIIIDRNPSPVAATFRFGDGFKAGRDVGERRLETRVRLDSFSKVRAIAETADGNLHMSAKFVTGAGGCSAQASKDAEAALASLGKVQLKTMKEPVRGESWREAVVMIRHPNFTGLQMDPITRGYTPLRIVNDLVVKRSGEMVLRMEGGISISENPHLRFNFDGSQGDEIEVEASDTEGARFAGRSVPSGS